MPAYNALATAGRGAWRVRLRYCWRELHINKLLRWKPPKISGLPSQELRTTLHAVRATQRFASRASCFTVFSDSIPGSAAAIFLKRAWRGQQRFRQCGSEGRGEVKLLEQSVARACLDVEARLGAGLNKHHTILPRLCVALFNRDLPAARRSGLKQNPTQSCPQASSGCRTASPPSLSCCPPA